MEEGFLGQVNTSDSLVSHTLGVATRCATFVIPTRAAVAVAGRVRDNSFVEIARVFEGVLRHVRKIRQRGRANFHGSAGPSGQTGRWTDRCTRGDAVIAVNGSRRYFEPARVPGALFCGTT